uniref:Biotin carboxyl carrier protein of acetyl-CoA carboxylase n=1 Tax=Dipterosiphonia australica TaxID=2007208 RepID=A0A1Z1MLY0_9FLOR|nr:acetyl-CoA carboxylase biotin carboxyl carrier protein [Dipterosiphonia australica]ARW66859.1 acetyl-CoA carboxylase biotin carboxyl carrier protein [Dipterosiphonia australica]
MINIKNLTKLINSTRQQDINKLKIENKQTKIIVNKTKKQKYIKNILEKTVDRNYKQNSKKVKTINENIQTNKDLNSENNIEHTSVYSTIISPMVGTFYKSPAPNERAFIEVGEVVKRNQTVCIIEAMKLMNEIESEVNGEVVEILIKDGEIVDCGQALIKIKVK